MDACPHAHDHERRSERALAACTHPGDDGPAGAWRYLVLVGDSAAQAVEFAVYQSQAAARTAVAVARATDELGTYWAEPVMVGKRPTLDRCRSAALSVDRPEEVVGDDDRAGEGDRT